MEAIYFTPHLKEFLFLKELKTKTIVIRLADSFPSLFNKEKINLFFENNGKEYNIVRLCLVSDKKHNEKNLKKCFPLYAVNIMENINNCQGIQFHVRNFTDDQWLSPQGFRLIKERYPGLLLILTINSRVFEEVEYKPDILAQKILMYSEYIDAVNLNFNPMKFTSTQEIEYFIKEIIKSLKYSKKRLN